MLHFVATRFLLNLLWDQKVPGSNPGAPIVRRISSATTSAAPRLTNRLADPRLHGLSPTPTCGEFISESIYKVAGEFRHQRLTRSRRDQRVSPLSHHCPLEPNRRMSSVP